MTRHPRSTDRLSSKDVDELQFGDKDRQILMLNHWDDPTTAALAPRSAQFRHLGRLASAPAPAVNPEASAAAIQTSSTVGGQDGMIMSLRISDE